MWSEKFCKAFNAESFQDVNSRPSTFLFQPRSYASLGINFGRGLFTERKTKKTIWLIIRRKTTDGSIRIEIIRWYVRCGKNEKLETHGRSKPSVGHEVGVSQGPDASVQLTGCFEKRLYMGLINYQRERGMQQRRDSSHIWSDFTFGSPGKDEHIR